MRAIGPKIWPSTPRHGEQRHEAGHDDGGGKEDRAVHLRGRIGDGGELAVQAGGFGLRAPLIALAHGRTLSLDRWRKMFSIMITVASTTRPKSIAPTDRRLADSPRSVMMSDGEQQREGNGGGDDHGAAQIAQEQPLHQEDQHDARHHVVQHRMWW